MTTAVAAPDHDPRPLYVLRLEEAIRELDRVISSEMPQISAEHPGDHGLTRDVAELIVSLR